MSKLGRGWTGCFNLQGPSIMLTDDMADSIGGIDADCIDPQGNIVRRSMRPWLKTRLCVIVVSTLKHSPPKPGKKCKKLFER